MSIPAAHASTARPNRLARSVAKLDRVPAALRPWLRNKVMGRAVPFTGTAGLNFAHMAPERVEIAVANVRRVQNHIQGVHAAAMALLAETATGMVVGMNVRDDCLPLAKTMRIDTKRFLARFAVRDLMPSLRASRFVEGARRFECRVVYSPQYVETARVPRETLAVLGVAPRMSLNTALRG